MSDGNLSAGSNLSLVAANGAGDVNLTRASVTVAGRATVQADHAFIHDGARSSANRWQIQTQAFSNTGGELKQAGTGAVQDGQALQINARQFDNQGRIESNGDVLLQADTLNNGGTVRAVNDLKVRAQSVSNSGLLAAGRRVDTEGDVLVNTGAIVGSGVTAQASTRIVNSGPSALIAATDREGTLELLAPVVHNRDDSTATDTSASASIVGLGRVVIAGGKDAQGQYTRAGEVLNQSAVIESGGDMSVYASTLTNERRVLRLTSGYTQTLPKEVLDRLGISLSGRVGYYNMPISKAALQPGGAYIDPPHGGPKNSDYHYTLYYGTALGQGIEAISPQAQMLAGGDFYADVGTLNNRYSQIAAGGNVNLAEGATVNQLSVVQQIRVVYTGTYDYRTYKDEQWQYSFCESGCNKGADIRYYTQSAYNASLTANKKLSGNGLALNNQTIAQQPAQGSAIVAQANARDWLSRLSVPGSGGMYTVVPSPTSRYLVNTNPAFTDHDRFVSSDYYFNMMGVNPAQIQKRLGDAYYEQQIVQGQILQLTGRKVLAGYADTQAEYIALMAAGAELAQSIKLAPGVGLSAEQARQLTRNVVIMQEQVVDGQKVLVPVVYLAAASQRDLGGGAVVAAANIDLGKATLVSNSGQIAADQNLTISAQRLDNQGGRLGSGQQMTLTTTGDMNLAGAHVQAGALALEAGGNVNLSAETHTQTQSGAWGTRTTTTVGPQASIEVDRDARLKVGGNLTQNAGALTVGGNLDARVDGSWTLGTATANETQSIHAPGTHAEASSNNLVGSAVRVGGNTQVSVGQDLVAQGAAISLQGGTVQAQGSIRLEAAQATSTAHSTHQSKGSNGLNSTSHFDERNTTDQSTLATQLQSGGNLALAAGRDVQVLGSSVTLTSDAQGQGALNMTAGRDVVVAAVTERHQFDQTNAGDVSNRHSSSTETDRVARDTTLSLGSSVSANTINVRSGQDVAVKGSAVVATGDATIVASRDLSVTASSQQDRLEQSSYNRKDGLMSSGGLSVTDGTQITEQTNVQTRSTSQASTVGSVGGNVTLKAGRGYDQVGSDVAAPAGDIRISAQTVNIKEARDTASETQKTEARQSGVTLAVTNPVLSAGRKIEALSEAAGKTSSGRMKALAAGSAALVAKGAADAVQSGQADPQGSVADKAGGVGINVSVGASSSQGKSEAHSDTARGSTVVAGGNVTIEAQGAGKASDITVQGSDISAGKTTTLAAEHDVNLKAAQNTSSIHSENSSSGASVGVGFNVGAKRSGFTVNVALSQAQGNTDGDDLSYSNTHVSGQTVAIKSGADTTLRGATVQGEKVSADVGGNLTIESLQDRSHYKSDSSSVGVGVSVPIGAGTGSASIDVSQSKISSDYASVTEQSGIRAGKGGFDVKVGGNTTLVGGAITSTQEAVDGDKNRFSTGGTLTTRDIENHADYEASSTSIGISSSGPTGTGNGLNPSLSGVGMGDDGGKAKSVTTAGISGVAGDKGKRTGDKEQGVSRIFDANKVSQEIQAQTTITRVTTQEVNAVARELVDEAKRTMFLKKVEIREILKDEKGEAMRDDNGVVMTRVVPDSEKLDLKTSSDGRVHIANNGIFNNTEQAVKNATQNSTTTGPQYVIVFPEADNFVSELLVAGYQKFLEGKSLGLSNATQANVDMVNQYGESGLHLDGHSRGSLTVNNALEYIAEESDSAGRASNTTVNFFGPAANAKETDNTLAQLQGRDSIDDTEKRESLILKMQNHVGDPIGTVIGGNPATGGTIPSGSSVVKEQFNAVQGKDNTTHNCYGTAPPECSEIWKNGNPLVPVR